MGPFTSSKIAVEETLEKADCNQKTASIKGKISKRFSMKLSSRGGFVVIIFNNNQNKSESDFKIVD